MSRFLQAHYLLGLNNNVRGLPLRAAPSGWCIWMVALGKAIRIPASPDASKHRTKTGGNADSYRADGWRRPVESYRI